MGITAADKAAAQAVQHAAAHDGAAKVRLVAGPGSGKSATIEERVSWLLGQGVAAAAIFGISFTRASSNDLRQRVQDYCTSKGHADGGNVRISTIHSLGLKLLRLDGQLAMYPADPLVLDNWETETIFDGEFGHAHNIGKSRREEIRREHEAFWSTGVWAPANYIPPTPAITAAERALFNAFHTPRTQAYACVLPGEVIRQCVARLAAGIMDPVALLNLEHLIVDEFQDLNPLDLDFVGHMIQRGVKVFVAGDDDQSVYSFRFAAPSGIQTFPAKYAGTAEHELAACFRCPPDIMGTAIAVIAANAAPGRIAKHQHSLYATSTPPVAGTVHRWRFTNATHEATAIAESCRDLIAAGMSPTDILILLSNQRALASPQIAALETAGVAFEHPREQGFLDSKTGRLTLAIVRLVCSGNDYVSLRSILGLRKGVGVGSCHSICDAVITNNLNFRDLFYNALPAGVFSARLTNALNLARATCANIVGWAAADTVASRSAAIHTLVENHFSATESAEWDAYYATLPVGMNIEELRDFLWVDTDEQQIAVLEKVLTRLGQPIPATGVLPPRVRIMTMHGAKGLSAKAVFIPGLEEQVFPGPWRSPYPGLVLEAARLLYVSITRARAACILSYADRRPMNGAMKGHNASRFAANVGGAFAARGGALSAGEITQIMTDCGNL